MDDALRESGSDLYDADLYAWTQQQAAILRSGCLASLDLANVLEEIESLGRSQINALKSRYAILSLHLLKLIVQPGRETRGWHLTIVEQRLQIARLLDENPALKARRARFFEDGYKDGRKLCVAETGLDAALIPLDPPFTLAQAEDESWLPAAKRD